MIDIENLKQFLGSDEGFIAVLMEKFIQEIPKEGKNLKTQAKERDWKRVRASSHKMLSSTKIFNLDELTSILQQIEKFSETQTNLEEIPGLISKFELYCKKVLEEMEQSKEVLESEKK